MGSPSAATRRIQRYRARKRAGVRVIPVEVKDAHVSYLTDFDLLDQGLEDDRAEIAGAIGFLLDVFGMGAVDIDWDKVKATMLEAIREAQSK